MRTPRRIRTPLAITLIAGAGAMALGVGIAPAGTGAAAPAAAKKITRKGVDGVRLGRTFQSLRTAGLVGQLRPGCELAGPDARSARLKAPLKGSVDFTQTTPRRVMTIAVRGGAKARGVGIGATIPDIKAAYPKAKVDHSTEPVFAITLVKVPKGGGGKLQFAVDTASGKVTLIGIPRIAFCD
jgi:hypothetical protein